MKLMGNVAGVTVPRPDWTQTDPARADFIRNKPDLAALGALAAEGKTLAELRLLRSGDTMTGNLGMSGNRVTGLGAPVAASDAVNKEYADGKRLTATAVIPADWSGAAAPYTQSVAVAGLLPSDCPHVTPRYADAPDTALAQREAWSLVGKGEAGEGGITFTCFEEKPTTEIPIQIEVMR